MSNVSFSDHSSILFKLNHTKPPPRKITINRRSLSNIDFAAFNDDISSSLLFNDDCDDLSPLVTRYDQVLYSLLDAHAPSRQRSIIVRPKAQWYTSEIASQKRLSRDWSICGAVRSLRRIESSIRSNLVWLMIFYMLLNKHTIVKKSRRIRIIRNLCFQLSTSCFT